ncbi:hypothetical protein CDL12_30220 [Handroanthus impetiginosus]|uniref:Uncharacterized protein n=1 Tax=Handroanthus impetiginosus TaxID=429701 RepID=A0A2G9FW74_9LAMI|nr:hypothetical protein CDL12_30220 [Handroanthus impetiginosus]
MHPYPRKQVSPVKTGISIPEKPARSASEENQSPTSVLSAVGSDSSGGMESCTPKFVSEDVISSVPDCEDGNSSPDEQIPLELELSSQNIKEDLNESAAQSLKLFGKTFSVVDPRGSSYSTDKTEGACVFPWRVVPLKVPMSWGSFSDSSPTSAYSTEINFSTRKMSDESNKCCAIPFPWLTLCNNSSHSTLEVHSPTPIKPRPSCDKKDNDEQKEGSVTGSNTDSVSASTHEGKNREADSSHVSLERNTRNEKPFLSYKLSKRISADCRKGFVPYKRCLAEQRSATFSSTESTEEREKQRVRLCL